jgi:DNA-binding response OmpR family regulator
MRILLVEDDKRLCDVLAFHLKNERHVLDIAQDGMTGLDYALSVEYDLILLDRMLPAMDGLALLRRIRTAGKRVPVLFLTARDTIEERITGLDAGADDYLVKPFSIGELLARVRALYRRPQALVSTDWLSFEGLELNSRAGALRCGGVTIDLTAKESRLMDLLIRNNGQVLSKEAILDRVWGLDDDVEPGNVDTYLHFLRKKLQALEARVKIRTLRGIGVCLERK